MGEVRFPTKVRRWDVFEVCVQGTDEGNPFVERWIRGTFVNANETKQVDGFYDGDGRYCVRFMPSFTGKYCFTLEGNFAGEAADSCTVDRTGAVNQNTVEKSPASQSMTGKTHSGRVRRIYQRIRGHGACAWQSRAGARVL